MVTDAVRVTVFVVLVLAGGIWQQLRHIRRRLDAEAEALHRLAEEPSRPD